MNLLFTLLLFESVSTGELLVILFVAFIFFGPKKIPEIAKAIAKGIYDIKKATGGLQEEINKTIEPIKKELNLDFQGSKNNETSAINSEEKKKEMVG